jgi:glycosyltransferase involved in cell wall biosynthesis
MSIHVVRCLAAIADRGWDVHLFAADHTPVHFDLRNVTLHVDPFVLEHYPAPHPSVAVEPLSRSAYDGPLMDRERAAELARVIGSVEPDLLHTMETQTGGYLALEARRSFAGSFPPWIVGLFGIDLYYYARIARHQGRLRGVMSAADYVLADTHRDIALSRRLGFNGRFLPVMVTGGGFDPDAAALNRSRTPPSRRRAIAARLQADLAYRPRTVLAALERCADLLADYELQAYFLSHQLHAEAERICELTGMRLRIISTPTRYAPHDEILAMHSRSRVSIAAAVADGTSLGSIEAGLMGSLPVHSYQSAVGEWLQDGRTALLFDGDDAADLADALSRALTDDALVDGAADENADLVTQLDRRREAPRLAAAYARVLADQDRR